jgi:aryl-alcohol dehydrogenase-like predicted oxidoreductase
MDYTTLGSSGLKISRIALGCMSFGDTSRGFNQWALGDKAAEPVFRQAVELGITFWDTANACYPKEHPCLASSAGRSTRPGLRQRNRPRRGRAGLQRHGLTAGPQGSPPPVTKEAACSSYR